MPISQKISDKLKSSSWIRKMFEEGLQMKQKYGAENVFDLSFTLGPNLYANIIFNITNMSEIVTEISRITEEHPNSIYEVWYYLIQWVVGNSF